MNRFSPWFTAFFSLLIAGLDLYYKQVALNLFSAPTPPPTHFFTIGLHKNPGILFDIPVPQPLLWVVTLVLLVFLVRFAHAHKTPLIFNGVILTVAGALGNLIDRILNGFTTDYLLLITRSAFNLSDLLILGGLACLIVGEHRMRKQKTPSSTKTL